MAATNTLSQITLTGPVGEGDLSVPVSSTVGLTPGTRIYADGEMMTVVSIGLTQGTGTLVNVKRATDGTKNTRHDPKALCYVGAANLFQNTDPQGHPPEVVFVSPHINVLNGNIWIPLGDEAPAGNTWRWWSLQQNVIVPGPMGVRTEVQAQGSSDFVGPLNN